MTNVVEVNNLRKVFLSKQKEPGFAGSLKSIFKPKFREIAAVNDISFNIKKGEILAFIGPNGAGKSTTIKILTGILFPTSGKAKVLGFTPWEQREKLAFHIGSVFGQKPQLWFHLPPIDTFNLFSKIYDLEQKEYKERLEKYINLFEVRNYVNTPVRKLSLGQRMRCELIASLLHNPEVIFLDEPTIGMDIVAKDKTRDLIKEINQKEKTTILLTSHDAGDIEKICKRVIIINNGQIVFNNTVTKLKKSYLQTKRITIKLEKPQKHLKLTGCKIISNSGHNITIEADTSEYEISDIVKSISHKLSIQDITISDPPIEEIIGKIYRE